MPQKVVKGQALADFLANHLCCEYGIIDETILPWTLFFDGSNTRETTRAEIYILSHEGIPTKLALTFTSRINAICYGDIAAVLPIRNNITRKKK